MAANLPPLLKAKREEKGLFKVVGRKVAGSKSLRQHTRRRYQSGGRLEVVKREIPDGAVEREAGEERTGVWCWENPCRAGPGAQEECQCQVEV